MSGNKHKNTYTESHITALVAFVFAVVAVVFLFKDIKAFPVVVVAAGYGIHLWMKGNRQLDSERWPRQ